ELSDPAHVSPSCLCRCDAFAPTPVRAPSIPITPQDQQRTGRFARQTAGNSTSMTFDPRHAIVTASDSGIGKATAVALAKNGMDVGITWHSDSEGAESTAEEVRSHGRKAVVKQLDYTDLPACGVTIDLMIEELGGLEVFVNNVGTGASTFLIDTSYDQWRKIIATNLDGAFVCLRQAAKHMVKEGNGGRLIAVTSVHEHQPRV